MNTRRHRLALCLLNGLLLVVSLLSWPAATRAQERNDRLFIDLQVEPGEEPRHLCVIAQLGAESATMQLNTLRPYLLPGSGTSSTWRFGSIAAPAGLGAENGKIFAALKAMQAPARREDAGEPCGAADTSVCDPQIRVVQLSPQPAGGSADTFAPEWDRLFIRCAENVQHTQGPPRVAVLLFNFHLPPSRQHVQPVMNDLALDGTVASFQLVSVLRRYEFVEASSIGGHYAFTGSSSTEGRILRIPLTPRCRSYDVDVPPFQRNEAERACAAVELETEPERPVLRQAVQILPSGRFSIDLPYLTERATRTIAVEIGKPDASGVHRFEGRWSDPMPPRVIKMRARTISFSWHRHCLYPARDRCPSARLAEAGVDCSAPVRRGDACHYTCGPRESAEDERPLDFSLPTRVSFRSPATEDTWEEQLSYGGQELSGYVKPDERYLDVDFSQWTATTGEPLRDMLRRPGEQIDYVVIGAPGLPAANLKPASGPGRPRIRVPGVRCHDVLTYRIVGDRNYKQGTTRVERGRIALDAPSATADDMVSFGITAGAGAVVPFLHDDSGRSLVTRPYGVIQGVIVIRALPTLLPEWPAFARPLLEIRAGFLATTVAYFPLRVSDTSFEGAPAQREEVWFSRYPVDALVIWPVLSNLHVGAGAGAVLGHPFSTDDSGTVGSLQGSLSITPLLLSYRLGRSRASVEAAARVFPSEIVKAYEPGGFRGEPTVRNLDATSILFETKLRIEQ